SPVYAVLGDRFDGYFGNEHEDQVSDDDHATDILLIEASNADDVVRLGQKDATLVLPNPDGSVASGLVKGALHVDIAVRGQPFREIMAPWRAEDVTPLV